MAASTTSTAAKTPCFVMAGLYCVACVGSGISQACGQGQGLWPWRHMSALQMRCDRRGAGVQPLQGWVWPWHAPNWSHVRAGVWRVVGAVI